MPRRTAVLGSTGSIGTNTLDVVRAFPERFTVDSLSGHRNWGLLVEQAREFRPRRVVVTGPDRGDPSELPPDCQLLFGEDALCEVAASPEVDVVVAAIVGAAGLRSTLAAIGANKTVALANKETLVVAGSLVEGMAKPGQLLPVDSEHSAVFQCLASHPIAEVERVMLTGSGGPFRGYSAEQLEHVSVEQALKHPTWQMGAKITIDSATLMNKALELIEARWLFGLDADRLGVVIHPQSVVHSFVEFRDGSVLAQASPPDMRLPIQYALCYPDRPPGPAKRLDWSALRQWTFEPPDREVFGAIDLGFEVIRSGGTSGAVLNAANEEAVARFLDRKIALPDVTRMARDILHRHTHVGRPTLSDLLSADRWARQEAARWTRP